jgi:aryl-alcohol dehydrogenase-like predicted oxidoreductase
MAEGVTLVDTAEMYGNGASERMIGEILREGGFEGTPVIATKFAPLPYRFSAKSLLDAVDRSLERTTNFGEQNFREFTFQALRVARSQYTE